MRMKEGSSSSTPIMMTGVAITKHLTRKMKNKQLWIWASEEAPMEVAIRMSSASRIP